MSNGTWTSHILTFLSLIVIQDGCQTHVFKPSKQACNWLQPWGFHGQGWWVKQMSQTTSPRCSSAEKHKLCPREATADLLEHLLLLATGELWNGKWERLSSPDQDQEDSTINQWSTQATPCLGAFLFNPLCWRLAPHWLFSLNNTTSERSHYLCFCFIPMRIQRVPASSRFPNH